MNVRRAEIKDAVAITEISVDTWKDTYKGLIDDNILSTRKVDEKRISKWIKNIQDVSAIVLVYEEDEILGYLWAGKARDNHNIKNELYALYVKKNSQRMGVGALLLNEYKKIINQENFYLYALKGNHKALSFYKKMGGEIFPKFNKKIEDNGNIMEELCFVFKEVING